MPLSEQEIWQKIQELPPRVREFFLGMEFALRNADIFDKHGITDRAAKNKILDLEREVFAKILPLDRVHAEVAARLGIPQDAAGRLAHDLYTDQFAPVKEFFAPISPPSGGGDRGGERIKPNTPPSPPSSRGGIKGSETEVEREISHIKKAVLPSRISARTVEVPLLIKDAADTLIAELKKTIQDPALHHRLETAVVSRLRDVRDAMETRELFSKPVNQGGLGLSGDALETSLAKLEAKDQEIHKKLAEEEAASQAKAREEEQKSRAAREGARTVEEGRELDAVYAKVAGGVKKPKGDVAEVFRPPAPGGGNLKVSATTMATGRPKLQDVKYTPKLVGPVEELGLMTLDDFTKLGAKPTDAAGRIVEKVNVIRGESFELRNQAIKAWQKSPLMKLYGEIATESLKSGKPVTAVISDRAAKSIPTLTNEAFSAIMDLNRKLRN